MIQLGHKHATIFFNQKIIKHSFLEINEILQWTQVAIFSKLISSLKLNHLIQTINNHVNKNQKNKIYREKREWCNFLNYVYNAYLRKWHKHININININIYIVRTRGKVIIGMALRAIITKDQRNYRSTKHHPGMLHQDGNWLMTSVVIDLFCFTLFFHQIL